MKKSTLAILAYVAVNFTGILLILVMVGDISRQAKVEHRDYRDFGDSLAFLRIAVVVLPISLFLNFAWGVKALVDMIRRRDYRAAVAFAAVAAGWMISCVILKRME